MSLPRQRQTTRLETFVDAAFAFAASFAITVMFWHGHHRWSRRFGLEDGTSVVLSLLLVFLVLVFLYPLRLMMSGALNSMSGGWLPSEFRITELAHFRCCCRPGWWSSRSGSTSAWR